VSIDVGVRWEPAHRLLRTRQLPALNPAHPLGYDSNRTNASYCRLHALPPDDPERSELRFVAGTTHAVPRSDREIGNVAG
jgi:hypothetical protein